MHGFTAKVGGGWEEQGGQISLPLERDASTGNFLCGWREGFNLLTPQELTVDLRLLFGGAEAMIVTWYVAVKVEAAREGLAHEREVVQRLNQPIDDVISLLESDDEEVFDRSVDTIGSYRPSSCARNAIILFFERLPSLKEPPEDESQQGGLMALAVSASVKRVDPFWMPGVIAMPTERLRISDMSSDDEAEPEIGPPIASKKKGKNNVAAMQPAPPNEEGDSGSWMDVPAAAAPDESLERNLALLLPGANVRCEF